MVILYRMILDLLERAQEGPTLILDPLVQVLNRDWHQTHLAPEKPKFKITKCTKVFILTFKTFNQSPFRFSPTSAEAGYLCRLYLEYFSIQIKLSNCL